MEIEKLIAAVKLCGSSPRVEQCRECAYWAGGDMSKCIPRMTADAAIALEQLQTELERVRVERDAYEIYFMAVSSKPDCNTCEKRGCEYRPRVGDTVRANCPLYSGPEKED